MKTSKGTILALSGGYLPGFLGGGPIRSVANLVEVLGSEFQFKVLTLDRDHGSEFAYPGIKQNAWQRVGKANVFYVSPERLTLMFMRRIINATAHDILYLNSLFSPYFSIAPIILRRFGLICLSETIIAPRGELSTGALRIKASKKKSYIALAKAGSFYRGVMWQATSREEDTDIHTVFPAAKTYFAPPVVLHDTEKDYRNGDHAKNITKRAGELKVAFLSRISCKKNLDGALRMLRPVQGDIVFNVYGPIEDVEYWKKCQREGESLPSNIKVRYVGPVDHDEVVKELSRNDLFFLPTHGENYGHVFVEALLAGCPLLISDTTPWRNLEQRGVGWDLPLDRPDMFTMALRRCVDMGNDEFKLLSSEARNYGLRIVADEEMIARNRILFSGNLTFVR